MLEGALGLLGDVDLAFLEALGIRSLGVRSTSSMASARSRMESGTISRTRTRVIWATTSLRLSMCWMLTVV